MGGMLYSQDEYIVNHSKFMQKTNPSYFGFNSLNRTGVLFNQMKLNEFDKMDNKYVFGALSFDNLDFSLGLDVNSFKIQNTGLSTNLANLSYVYKLQFDNDLFFLPAVTLGFGSTSVNPANLIFEDQLNTATGLINPESLDDLARVNFNSNYLDLGASFLLANNLGDSSRSKSAPLASCKATITNENNDVQAMSRRHKSK